MGGRSAQCGRLQLYLTDLLQAGEFARLHGEVFKDIDRVLTAVQVDLTQPGLLVKIDVDAVIHDKNGEISGF